jgi:hypothetical protein
LYTWTGRSRQVSGPDGRVNVSVIVATAGIDVDVSSVQLDVLVAPDPFDAQFPGSEGGCADLPESARMSTLNRLLLGLSV